MPTIYIQEISSHLKMYPLLHQLHLL